jgi:hypothetical protein
MNTDNENDDLDTANDSGVNYLLGTEAQEAAIFARLRGETPPAVASNATPAEVLAAAKDELNSYLHASRGRFVVDERTGQSTREGAFYSPARHAELQAAATRAKAAADADRRAEGVRYALMTDIERNALDRQRADDEFFAAKIARDSAAILGKR